MEPSDYVTVIISITIFIIIEAYMGWYYNQYSTPIKENIMSENNKALNAAAYLNDTIFLKAAKQLALTDLRDYTAVPAEATVDDMYVVWFSKTLKNWKALVSTDVVKGYYIEVTYNGDNDHAYVDVYHKELNIDWYNSDSKYGKWVRSDAEFGTLDLNKQPSAKPISLDNMRAILDTIQHILGKSAKRNPDQAREFALAKTKIEEASLWLSKTEK
jgi:hypothetical protein